MKYKQLFSSIGIFFMIFGVGYNFLLKEKLHLLRSLKIPRQKNYLEEIYQIGKACGLKIKLNSKKINNFIIIKIIASGDFEKINLFFRLIPALKIGIVWGDFLINKKKDILTMQVSGKIYVE